eukprot:12122845-Alexandrium_andersonii.AAC.1
MPHSCETGTAVDSRTCIAMSKYAWPPKDANYTANLRYFLPERVSFASFSTGAALTVNPPVGS